MDNLIEKIPEKLQTRINETKKKKAEAVNTFYALSVQIVNLQNSQKDTLNKIKNSNESLKAQIENAFGKLRLKKKTGYNWQYNGSDSFIGVPKPEPKK